MRPVDIRGSSFYCEVAPLSLLTIRLGSSRVEICQGDFVARQVCVVPAGVRRAYQAATVPLSGRTNGAERDPA